MIFIKENYKYFQTKKARFTGLSALLRNRRDFPIAQDDLWSDSQFLKFRVIKIFKSIPKINSV